MYSYMFARFAVAEFQRLHSPTFDAWYLFEIYEMLKSRKEFHEWMETYAMKGI